MRLLIPRPVTSATLLALWLLVNESVAPGQVLLGAALALLIPRLTARFDGERARLRSVPALLPLAAVFLWDVVTANIAVARLVLGPTGRLQPRLFEVALDARSPMALSMLAGIVSLTPGTVAVDLSADRRVLLVHGLDVADPAQAAAQIKQRYERRILQVFEC